VGHSCGSNRARRCRGFLFEERRLDHTPAKFLVLDAAFYFGDEPRTQIFAGAHVLDVHPAAPSPAACDARR
jgi:hypothetical protein